jgi:hypothetical protein
VDCAEAGATAGDGAILSTGTGTGVSTAAILQVSAAVARNRFASVVLPLSGTYAKGHLACNSCTVLNCNDLGCCSALLRAS